MTEPKDCAREHPMSDYCGTHGTRLETCARLDALAASKDAALAALRERLAAAEKRAETAEALVRELAAVAKVANGIATHKHICLGDLVYTVRESEGLGWDGPGVKSWSNNVGALEKALAALSDAARKEIER